MGDNRLDISFSSISTFSMEINPSSRNRNNGFSFIVDKNKKPEYKNKLKNKKSSDDVINNFFLDPQSSLAIGKEFQPLNSSFEEEYFYLAGDCPLIEGYRSAYLHHFPIVINPNYFWLMILQGFSKHMEIKDNSKRNRHKFVDFEGKKEIKIETGLNLFRASDDQWQIIIDNLLKETSKNITNINKDILNLINAKFSTSTREQEIANNVTFLSIFKKYFKYKIMGTCGISQIIIEGTIQDWELLLKKIIEIGSLDEEIVFWTNEIKTIINKIIETLQTQKPDINFYKNMVQNTDRSRECQPDLINGWIIKFIPYDKNNNKSQFNSPEFNGLSIENIPSQIVGLPFNIQNLSKIYNAEIYTGFFGVTQDELTLEIKPVIGYAILQVKNKIKNTNENEQMRQNQFEFQRGIQLNNRLQPNLVTYENNAYGNNAYENNIYRYNTYRNNFYRNNDYRNNIYGNNVYGNNAFGNNI